MCQKIDMLWFLKKFCRRTCSLSQTWLYSTPGHVRHLTTVLSQSITNTRRYACVSLFLS